MNNKVYLPKEQANRILIDTNLLLLLLVGIFDKGLISTFKRTRNLFVPEDFDKLSRIVGNYSKIVTTPHILTEISDFCDKVTGKKGDTFSSFFAEEISLLEEVYEPSKKVSETEAFRKFGLTDAAIFCISKNQIPVLTIDFPLQGYLVKNNVKTINFNHFRNHLFR